MTVRGIILSVLDRSHEDITGLFSIKKLRRGHNITGLRIGMVL